MNCVAPGPFWSPLQITGGQPQSAIPTFGQQTPLGRAGQPVELSGTYVLLASEDSSYTTGQVFGVTGGTNRLTIDLLLICKLYIDYFKVMGTRLSSHF